MDPSIISSRSAPNLRLILSDSLRIVAGANSRQFLLLSLLFLFPSSIFNVIYLFLFPPSIPSVPNPQNPNGASNLDKSHLFAQILYFLITVAFTLSATASITFTALRGFHRMPVDLISSIKSIRLSFFPLLATKLTITGLIWLITFVSCIGLSVLFIFASYLGYAVSFSNQNVVIFVILLCVLISGVIIYATVEWELSSVVVIVESQWGVAPLKRSSILVKGMRLVVLKMILLFGVIGGGLSFGMIRLARANGGGFCLMTVVGTVVYAIIATVLSLFGNVANTVLFVYCKGLNGEEVDVELGLDYTKVATDEDRKLSTGVGHGFVAKK